MTHSRSVDVEALSPRCALVCEGPERSASRCICEGTARARHILHTNPRDKDGPQFQVQVVHSFRPTFRFVSGLVKVLKHSVKDLEAHPCICPARFLTRRIIQAEPATSSSGFRSGEAETMKNGSPALLDNELPVAFSARLPKIKKITCLF